MLPTQFALLINDTSDNKRFWNVHWKYLGDDRTNVNLFHKITTFEPSLSQTMKEIIFWSHQSSNLSFMTPQILGWSYFPKTRLFWFILSGEWICCNLICSSCFLLQGCLATVILVPCQTLLNNNTISQENCCRSLILRLKKTRLPCQPTDHHSICICMEDWDD